MAKQRFNPEEYASLKHRFEQLKSRVELDSGPEQETAKRLLSKVERKLKAYEETHEIPKQATQDYTTTSGFDFWENFNANTNTNKTYGGGWNPNFKWHVHFEDDKTYHEDTRTESEMINDLGVLYMIFGSTYQTILNYHIYKIRFKKRTNKSGAFYRVYADIFEDDIRICKNIIIGFWPFNFGDDRCGDMEFATMDSDATEKYNNGCSCLYTKLLDGLKDIWNSYFFDVPMLPVYTEAYQDNYENKLMVQLDANQRKEVIERVENEIDSGKMKHLKSEAISLEIMAYRPYNSLADFLDESGVVYQVDSDGVYIWNYWKKEFGKLVGYDYDRARVRYSIYLL